LFQALYSHYILFKNHIISANVMLAASQISLVIITRDASCILPLGKTVSLSLFFMVIHTVITYYIQMEVLHYRLSDVFGSKAFV
jgi:hypothetical protein